MLLNSKMKSNAELRLRDLSEKAMKFYDNTDPMDVYYSVLAERFYIANCDLFDENEAYTFDELQATFESLYDDFFGDDNDN